MPNEQQTIKYISLDNLTLYTQLMKSYVDSEDAKSIKTVMLSQDGHSLLFYRDEEPISAGATAAYSIQIPETNLDSCMKKVVSALSGNIATFNSAGQVVDGGVALSSLVTTTDVQTMIAQAIASSSHMTATVVQTLPTDAEADDNVIYLVYDSNATGSDLYKEYLKINGTLTLIGDTSTNLSNYLTTQQVTDRISAAQTAAVSTAVTQANAYTDTQDAATLTSANNYTDQEIGTLSDALDAVETKADTNTSNISTLSSTVTSNTDRITLLEQASGLNISIASEAEIRALFTS